MPEHEASPNLYREIAPGQEDAKKELAELGLEATAENMTAIKDQKESRQHPDGFQEFFHILEDGDQDKLKQYMAEKNLKSVIHSEGPAVWDHAKLAILEIDALPIPDETKKDLKILMLYHDLGKTTAGKSEQNIEQTKKKLAKGELGQSMIGHPKERLEDIGAGFRSNGITGDKLRTFMIVVENHMNTSLLDQDPKKTVKLFESFGATDEERKKVVELLTLVLQTDGNATEHVDLAGGEIQFSKNEKKLKLDFNAVWNKYQEGLNILRQETESKKKQEAEAGLENSILGKKLSDYLVQDRGIKPGPEMGKAVKIIKKLIDEHKNASPGEIKNIIDSTSL